jgi:hypothetical protein
MVIGCNRMLVVTQDFFFQATGGGIYLPYFQLVDSCIDLSSSVIVISDDEFVVT